MTQILNNMKRKEKKRKEKKGLFYLIGIAIMVAIMGISCSAKATAPADFSETEDFVEAPAPEVKPSVPEQTPQKFEIDDRTGVQFVGKSFTDGNKTITIVTPKNNDIGGGFELDGKEYRITSRFYNNPNLGPYVFSLVNDTDGIKKGYAEFNKNASSLDIWFSDNQSDKRSFKELVK